jgi:hypothetical protein
MTRILIVFAGVLLFGTQMTPLASALPPLFSENFDGLILGPPVDETVSYPRAFTHTTPSGWTRDASGVPGVGNPDVGVFEWEGWSFADKQFWIDAAPNGSRELFDLAKGTIAVADPDQWNDLGDPANKFGFYKTLLKTPAIDVTPAAGLPLKLLFDSSWRGGCCDDGELFDPDGNNQTAVLTMYTDVGPPVEIFRWESAPYRDPITGRPSTDPMDDPNPNYKEDAPNEEVVVDVRKELDKLSSPAKEASFEFAVEQAGDDGWWAIDNTSVVPLTTILGDMNINDMLDPGDFEAFALGMRSTSAYRAAFFGEFPVTRGSLDGVFDFDDIPWFRSLMNETAGAGSGASAGQIPEPATTLLMALGIATSACGTTRRDRRRRAH